MILHCPTENHLQNNNILSTKYCLFQADLKFYRTVAATCNVFRELTDIYDSWDSVIGQIYYFGDDPGNFSAVAGPGAWNDPDQVETMHFFLLSTFCCPR